MSPTTIAIVIVAVVALIVLVLTLASGQRKRRLSSAIPPAMRPMYDDDELEGNHLERMMAFGVLLTLFFAIFLPAYWLREPTRAQDKQEGLFARDFSRGEQLYNANCTECHGAGLGGSAPSPYGEDSWPAPNLLNIVQRYEDSRIVADIRDHIETTLYRGRPGTPMPTWGAQYGGPMTDFQIEAITDWILANQLPAEGGEDAVEAEAALNNADGMSGEDLYLANCARCHGTELQGIVGPSLIGVTARHSDETLLGILQNGIKINPGAIMPPWQQGYMYPESAYTDDALNRIIDYLHEAQPDTLPEGSELYQTPGLGEPVETQSTDDTSEV